MAQDYTKDLAVVIVGSGNVTKANVIDLMEDYVFGEDLDSREVKLLIPYTKNMGKGMDVVLNQWAVGADRQNPDWDIYAFVEPEAGHRSVASAKKAVQMEEENGISHESMALEVAMDNLCRLHNEGHEVAVVVLFDAESDMKLLGEIKNYNGIPILNLCEGLIDSFPGFKTTDEILKEEREREEFETKEAIRIAAEKEQEKLEKAAEAPVAKKAAAPRKRVAKKAVAPVEKPLTEKTTDVSEEKPKSVDELMAELNAEKAAAREPDHKVGDTVVVAGIPFTKHSELPSELEPVKVLPPVVDDVWADVARAQASVDGTISVKKEHLVTLGQNITKMSEAFSETIATYAKMLEEL